MRDLRAICNQNRSDLYRRRHNHSKQHCRAVMIEQARQLLPTPEMKGRECRKLTERFHSTDQASLALPDACRFSSQRLPASVAGQQLPQKHGGYPVDAIPTLLSHLQVRALLHKILSTMAHFQLAIQG